MGMEVVAQVLLGPKFPALSYLCGEWNEDTWPDPGSVGLAVDLLDKAHSLEVRLDGSLGIYWRSVCASAAQSS